MLTPRPFRVFVALKANATVPATVPATGGQDFVGENKPRDLVDRIANAAAAGNWP